jgi:hypothetical protein
MGVLDGISKGEGGGSGDEEEGDGSCVCPLPRGRYVFEGASYTDEVGILAMA